MLAIAIPVIKPESSKRTGTNFATFTPHDKSWAYVIGCSHSPNPCRMPMDRVTMAAPQIRTCVVERGLGEARLVMGCKCSEVSARAL